MGVELDHVLNDETSALSVERYEYRVGHMMNNVTVIFGISSQNVPHITTIIIVVTATVVVNVRNDFPIKEWDTVLLVLTGW